MKFFLNVLLFASYATCAIAAAQDVKKDWVVVCERDKFSDIATCSATKLFPEWQGATPQIPIKVSINKIDRHVVFSFHDYPGAMAKLRIDRNEPFIQGTNIIAGDRADKLIDQMINGQAGSISTRLWPRMTYDFDFKLDGFPDAYAKLLQSYREFK